MVDIKVKPLRPGAKLPMKGSPDAAGFDLFALEGFHFSPKFGIGQHLFKLGFSIEIPRGYYGRIAPRSGLALKMGVDVLGGVIDSDYRGEVGVILHSLKPFIVRSGDRIAQLIIEKHEADAQLVWDDELAESIRGEGGFGSTGS